MSTLPLLVFDTNIVMDVHFGRDERAVLLVELAEQKKVELVVPEYVLFEFRGTALRWIREEVARLSTLRSWVKAWERSHDLGPSADTIRSAANAIEERLRKFSDDVDQMLARIREVATVKEHTSDLHFRGDLRYLKGLPPDKPVAGIKDCRIYEAVLAIANEEADRQRKKFLVTKDSDFNHPTLVQELGQLGFTIRNDLGALYGELEHERN